MDFSLPGISFFRAATSSASVRSVGSFCSSDAPILSSAATVHLLYSSMVTRWPAERARSVWKRTYSNVTFFNPVFHPGGFRCRHLCLQPAQPRQELKAAGHGESLDAVLPRPLNRVPGRVVFFIGAAEHDIVEQVAHVVVHSAVGDDAAPPPSHVLLQACDVGVDTSEQIKVIENLALFQRIIIYFLESFAFTADTEAGVSPPAASFVRLLSPCLEKNREAMLRASSCFLPSANMIPFL